LLGCQERPARARASPPAAGDLRAPPMGAEDEVVTRASEDGSSRWVCGGSGVRPRARPRAAPAARLP
jgi:hypothetical protein